MVYYNILGIFIIRGLGGFIIRGRGVCRSFQVWVEVKGASPRTYRAMLGCMGGICVGLCRLKGPSTQLEVFGSQTHMSVVLAVHGNIHLGCPFNFPCSFPFHSPLLGYNISKP